MTRSTLVDVEGTAPFHVDGEVYQTWYRIFGDLSDPKHTPLIILHGGPGLAHDYLLCMSDLAIIASIPVIFYDQIGNGRSTHLRHKPQSFWSIDLFLNELDNLLRYLDIGDNFDLLGQSYGGMLAAEFAVKRQPAGLKHMILSNSFPSMSLWNQSLLQLAEAFPQNVQEGLALGLSDVPKYKKALMQFYDIHGCTVKPAPKEYLRTLEFVFGDDGDITVGAAMFENLKHWTIVDRLHLICVPTFVINGRADFAQDFVVWPFFQHIKKVKWLTFTESSHMPMWEEQERYMREVTRFLVL